MTARVMCLSLLLFGCAPALEEGYFSCATPAEDECPAGWQCVSGRCYQSPPDASTPPMDSSPDVDADAGDSEVPPPIDACTPQPRAVDLLLMIDDSRSMAEEQAALTAAFPALVRALAEGDLDGDGRADFDPIASLRIGVVSSFMGVGGHEVPTCEYGDASFGDDGVLIAEHRGGRGECPATHPAFLEYTPPGGLSELQAAFTCQANLGTDGCGFEQQLEALLKAATPQSSDVRFFDNTRGHAGAGVNGAFFRDDAVLVGLVLSDEEDCSARDLDLFAPAGPYSGTTLNRRCDVHADDALWPTSRYAALAELKADPADFVYAALVGVPVEAERDSYDAILAHPDMDYEADPASMRLLPACDSGGGDAMPGRRYVEVAQALESEGAQTLVRSICRADFDGPVDELVRLIATRLDARCP